jgi:ABC-type amino acid transport substrate-binding protein
MDRPRLKTALVTRGHTKALKDGSVTPRTCHHAAILVNTKAGIGGPKDLEGRRVGVNRGYTVTTGLWARSILQHQYGVDPLPYGIEPNRKMLDAVIGHAVEQGVIPRRVAADELFAR